MEPLIKFVRMRSREETSWPKVWEIYRPPFEPYPLVLLSRPQALTHEEARRFADFVRERILSRYSENEHPELPVIS